MSLEPVAVPILIKAVDFLFGEAKKILDERRAARQQPTQPGVEVPPAPDIPLLDQSRDSVLRRHVAEAALKQKEQTIQSILDQITIYQGNLQLLEQQAALHGGRNFAPLIVVNQLKSQEDRILELSQRLAALVDELTATERPASPSEGAPSRQRRRKRPIREPEGPAPQPPPPGPENHLPLLAILFFNLIIAGTLGFIFNGQNASPCVHPFASMLSVGVIALNVTHLAWRTFRPNIVGNNIQVLGFQVSIRALDELHLWKLSNPALWFLAVVFIIAALVLGLSSLSPFRPIEATPVIQRFDVQFPDGSTRSYKPGEVLEITANQQVLVEAATVGQPSTLCAWSAVSGALQPAAGCSTLYSFPPGGEIDSLAVLVQSPCLTRQAFAGLSIIVSP